MAERSNKPPLFLLHACPFNKNQDADCCCCSGHRRMCMYTPHDARLQLWTNCCRPTRVVVDDACRPGDVGLRSPGIILSQSWDEQDCFHQRADCNASSYKQHLKSLDTHNNATSSKHVAEIACNDQRGVLVFFCSVGFFSRVCLDLVVVVPDTVVQWVCMRTNWHHPEGRDSTPKRSQKMMLKSSRNAIHHTHSQTR